jgi:molecular chaperone DnaJ
VRVGRNTPFGQFVSVQTCANCGGQGTVVDRPCPDCRGEGRVQRQRTLTIDVPAGIEDGQRLRLAGAGHAGERGGASGDLFVDVRVAPHPRLRRDGRDVWSEVTVGLAQAALGTEIEVETLEGRVSLEVPAGTQPGAELRLRGKGIVAVHGHERGDHRVVIRIEVPRHLSAAERDLLRRYAEAHGERVAAERGPLRRVLGR